MRAKALVLLFFLASSAMAQSADEPKEDPVFLDRPVEDLNEFVWEKRPIVVFADSPNDPSFREQIDLLRTQVHDLEVRDVVVLTDTDPAARGPLRTKLRPRGFALVLIGKDGGVKLRKPSPWNVREISRVIDKMPLRLQEVQERGLAGG
jgi:hypothetical protein